MPAETGAELPELTEEVQNVARQFGFQDVTPKNIKTDRIEQNAYRKIYRRHSGAYLTPEGQAIESSGATLMVYDPLSRRVWLYRRLKSEGTTFIERVQRELRSRMEDRVPGIKIWIETGVEEFANPTIRLASTAQLAQLKTDA